MQKSAYHHMRHYTKNGTVSPFGGITFFGELLGVTEALLGCPEWEVSAAATHTTDRFVRKTGNNIAYLRWLDGKTFFMPATTGNFYRDLYAHLAATGGKVYKDNHGVNNMIRNVYSKVVKPPKVVLSTSHLRNAESLAVDMAKSIGLHLSDKDLDTLRAQLWKTAASSTLFV